MGDKRNFAALDWVIGEITETLKEARQALEAYVEDPKDSTRIRFCLTHIHQVLGSLQMVEFHGASLLAEEMEQLAQALMDHKVTSAPEAQEVLMRSLLQLPTYLDHAKAQKEDNPGLVLPLLNDLRAVRNQSYLSETNLFSPNLHLLDEIFGSRHPITQDPAKLKQVLKKLREMYQFAAASVLRGIKVDDNLNYLDKVFSRMEALTIGTAIYPLWEVSAALIEGLLRDDIELSVAVRGLLRHIARELRILGEKAPVSLDARPRESLLKNLLYYIAKAESGGKKINRIKKRYKLAEAMLDGVIIGENGTGDSLSAPDPEAIRSVVVALNDEINAIKNVLDMSLSGHAEPEDLRETLPIVKRVADTLAVLGIGDLRKNVTAQYTVIEKLSKQNTFDEAVLLDVASKIIEIEHRLEAIAKVVGTSRDLATVNEREIEIDQAKITVIKECQHGLEQAKDAISEYISSKWDKSHLLNVGSLLHDIRGGLDIIPLPRPAAILGSCANYIQEQLIDKEGHPVDQALATLADAIASVEYFLERLLGDMDGDIDPLLDIAERSVNELGYPMQLAASSEATAEDVHAMAPASEPFTDAVREVAPTLVSETISTVGESETQQPESEQPAPVAEKIQPEPLAEPVIENVVPDDGEDLEESDIDDEIIEIFIEEAEEVLETLQEYFPQWRANQQDQDSLVVVRRAFHTLKGSGRMVEAFDIGELAWSIENMLNRVIDNTIPAVPSHAHIIELVLNLLPELIKAFANKKRNPHKAITAQYEAWANAMSDGNYPAELQAIPAGGPVPLPDFSAGAVAARSALEETATEAAKPETVASAETEPDIEDDENLVLMEIFSSEAVSHLATIEEFIHKMERDAPLYSPPSDDFQRALHTLKGSAKMAQITPIASVTEPLEAFAKELISYQVEINADILQLYRDAVSYTREALGQMESGYAVQIDRLDQFVARTAELRELAVGHLIRLKEMEQDGKKQVDPRLLSIFMAEEMNLLLDADLIVDQWQKTGSDGGQSAAICRELETLEKGAEQAKLPDMAALSAQLRSLYEQSHSGQQDLNEDFFAILGAGHDALLDMIDAVAAGQNVVPPSEEITSALASLIHNGSLVPAKDGVRGEGHADEQMEPATHLQDRSELPVDTDTEHDAGQTEAAETVADEDQIFDLALQTSPMEDLDEAPEAQVSQLEPSDEQSIVEDASSQEEQGEADVDIQNVPTNSLDDLDFGEISLDLTESLIDTEEPEEDESAQVGEAPATLVDEDQDFPSQEEEDISLDLEPEESLLADDDEPLYSELADQENTDADLPTLDVDTVEPETVVLESESTGSTQNEETLDIEQESQFDSEPLGESIKLVDEADDGTLELEEQPEGMMPFELVEEPESEQEEPLDIELEMEPEPESFEFSALESELVDEEQPPLDVSADEEQPARYFEVPEAPTALDSPDTEIKPETHAIQAAGSITGLLDSIDPNAEDYDPDMIKIFLEEAKELVESLDSAVHLWEADWSDAASSDEIKRALHTLKGGARLAGMSNLGELIHEYESYVISHENADPGDDFFNTVHDYQDKLHNSVQAINTAITGEPPEYLEPVSTELPPVTHTDSENLATTGVPESHTPDQDTSDQASSEAMTVPGLLDTIDVNAEDFDLDIVDIFLEEAEELIESLDEAVHAWESNWSDTESPEEIKRVLHTLKGGARLAGMANLGELTHSYESYLIGSKLDEVDDAFFAKVHEFQDQVLNGVRAVQTFMSGGATSAEPSPESDTEATSTEEPKSTDSGLRPTGHKTVESNVLPFAPRPREPETPGEFKMPAVKSGGNSGGTAPATLRKQAGPQEVVKVNADLLEELVNLAGETSISRARIEQQVNDFGRALDDIDATIARLQEQLRRLDIETEAQVLFRQEQMAAHEEFDPLEMDRYSQLQQLSRSLIESASDLLDLRQTLTDNIRDTETLLLQQSRINTTLQEGLMRSRMVPFSRLVPRLRRIVRQVAGELGKNVSFELDNVEGELDRSMLERMVPPLEHMLRNAVDHGIELPDQRRDAGKSENGRIVLTLGREGGDVILRLADDGRGVNLRRVREKAIERGLMAPDAELSDFDIMQFVLHAGFSTAETVTQISGRGVGMDVVSSEIKAMGGSVLINSEWGKGTEVVIRLPFTVSVNRALMVEIGQDNYAIPLNTIEGIVRVSPFELEHYYSADDARFEYAGENYQVRYLGTMLNDEVRPVLEGQALPLPVLLVRSADSTLAIQVDNLLGSREVVVKSLGSQFSAVQGLSGATLMGDGSVVVILDPHALVRKAMATRHMLEMQPLLEDSNTPSQRNRVKTVMVVDDSVTVRKVTTRFLEREGFNVITAKDGVDALRTLQDEIPDIMLLDIEMPRMDGFEVATNIRTTSRWKHIPIIMITSRTGEKHRERAMSLGVDKYMGKPYQEETLLAGLNELLAKAEGQK